MRTCLLSHTPPPRPQDEISWFERRFETRAPLTEAEKAAALRQLLEVR
jgi:hypothetical protein